MCPGRTTTDNNFGRIYFVSRSVCFDPCDRMFRVIHHTHEISFRKKPVSYIHDHMALRGKMPEECPGSIIFVKYSPCSTMQIDKDKPGFFYSLWWLPHITY